MHQTIFRTINSAHGQSFGPYSQGASITIKMIDIARSRPSMAGGENYDFSTRRARASCYAHVAGTAQHVGNVFIQKWLCYRRKCACEAMF